MKPLDKTGLLNEASVEEASVDLDKHLSMHPALRANHMTVGKTVLLAGMVNSGLPSVIGVEATSCRRPSVVGMTTNSRAAR